LLDYYDRHGLGLVGAGGDQRNCGQRKRKGKLVHENLLYVDAYR
jgi:hypothetical protein